MMKKSKKEIRKEKYVESKSMWSGWGWKNEEIDLSNPKNRMSYKFGGPYYLNLNNGT